MSVAIVLNLRARRGSERVARMIRALLPRARLAVTRSLEDARAFLRDLARDPPSLLLSGGGDGTAWP